ncbi:glycosyltransferase [Methylomonas albis]|uniref:Glycosyltransferase n=1 Tax=Methylomonas albis TaxID=1854563 RepID=A0ABR9D1Q2_9GAMM|nr:glycosyltransferase [Methylomonas albis]MBD9357049.1 glycosyltransferase [Methylomonas albis]
MTKLKSHQQRKRVKNKRKIASFDRKKSGLSRVFRVFDIRFVRFLIVGSINTGFSYAVYSFLLFLGVEYKLANFGSLVLGIVFSFNTQGRFVFGNLDNRLFVRFVICWFIIYIFNIFLIGKLIYFGLNAYEAGAVALVPVTLFSFCVQKLIVFRKTKDLADNLTTSNNPHLPRLFMNTNLAIVVPCYNEEEVLPETNRRLLGLMATMQETGLISENSGIYYVDDGSRDRTWELISNYNAKSSSVHGIRLSRNRGHQNALLAGVFNAPGDVVVSIDADLQDDINVIKEMVDGFNEGNEIIYGVRSSRKSDTFFKRFTAQLYYRILKLMGVDLVYNHADYRLMSRRVIDCLKEYNEVNLFLRGIIPQLGFRTATVFYERSERYAGESKYPLSKMLALAADGITSFSVIPLHMITWLGFFVSLGSLAMVVWILIGKFALNSTIPGWASSVLPIYFIGGIQLLSTGILGEYLSKAYMETKRRPRYFIEEII